MVHTGCTGGGGIFFCTPVGTFQTQTGFFLLQTDAQVRCGEKGESHVDFGVGFRCQDRRAVHRVFLERAYVDQHKEQCHPTRKAMGHTGRRQSEQMAVWIFPQAGRPLQTSLSRSKSLRMNM